MTMLPRLIPSIRRDRPRAASPWALALVCTLGLALAGCGEPRAVSLPKETLHPVKGSVVTAEGTPLTEGIITFVPVKGTTSREASAKIGADGTFTLKSGDASEGAAEGDYRVKIESPLTTPSTDPKKPNRVVPIAYEDEVSSQITITIKSGPNDLPPIKLVPVDPKKGEGAKEPVRD